MDSHVVFEKVRFARGQRTIFDNVSLSIPKGKITAVMGPSGSGKTTLLRLIGAQIAPHAGQVRVNDRDIQQLSSHELSECRRNMGMMFQSSALFTNLSVFDNVAFPIREHTTFSDPMIKQLVLMKLQAVGLRGAAQLMPSALSGGMARRVALARAIALDPALMMYDEPFTGQDPISMGILLKLIKELNEALGLTSVIVSHDVAEVMSIADKIYLISGGQVVGSGSADEIRNTQEPYVTQFVQGLPDGVVPFHYPANDYLEDLGL